MPASRELPPPFLQQWHFCPSATEAKGGRELIYTSLALLDLFRSHPNSSSTQLWATAAAGFQDPAKKALHLWRG